MKTIKNLLSIFVIIMSMTFVSCTEEPLDSSLISNNSNSEGGTSTGDYWPATINNSWSFSNNGAASQMMKIISTSNVNGATYYNFDSVFGQGAQVNGTSTMSMRKNAGNYYVKLEGASLNLGGGITATQSAFEFLILKDYLSVNQTWNGTYTQTTSYNGGGISLPTTTTDSNYTGTILGVGLTEAVDGETYNNVIKLKINQSITISGLPNVTTVETIYWFSKNIGPIKSQTLSNGSTTTSNLTDYVIN